MQEWCYVYPDELTHHGILGQKWGVRRYQYKDGSLTPAGRKRYKIDEQGNLVEKTKKERKMEAKQARKEKAEEAKRIRLERENETREKKKERLLKSRDLAQIYDNKDLFSDQELLQIYNRFNLERNLSNLVPKEKEKSYADIVDRLSKNIDSTVRFVDSGTKAYNAFAKIANSVSDSEFPVIGVEKVSARKKETARLREENEYYKALQENTSYKEKKTEYAKTLEKLNKENEYYQALNKNKKLKEQLSNRRNQDQNKKKNSNKNK